MWKDQNEDSLANKINVDIILIKQWCDYNLLDFNASKTGLTIFKTFKFQ